jgi:hypothetical protein
MAINKKLVFTIGIVILIAFASLLILKKASNLESFKRALIDSSHSNSIQPLIDSTLASNKINLPLIRLIEAADSLSKNEFDNYLLALKSIDTEKLKNDSTISTIISKVEKSKYANAWKEILYPHFYAIAKKTQCVNDWNNCIRLCPIEEEKQKNIHERRKIFLSFESFTKSNLNAEDVLKNNPCYSPLITKMDRIHDRYYTVQDLFNNNYQEGNYLRNRFILADFNTTNSAGECKGCNEEYAVNENIDELSNIIKELQSSKIEYNNIEALNSWFNKLSNSEKGKWRNEYGTLKNYLQHVDKYRTAPMKKDPIIYIEGKPYCIGQRLCLCEIQNDTIIKVAQFVTSSKNAKAPQSNQHDFDGQPRYYAPQNKITSRFWDRELKYDSLDRKHDEEMGKGSSGVLRYRGAVDLPNFMHITPVDEFPGAKGFVNGIHEFAVGGKRPGLFMGTPISLGCVRLHDYPSKFTRWWTPHRANMFIAYESKHYIQRPLKGAVEKRSEKIADDKNEKSSAHKEKRSSKKKK